MSTVLRIASTLVIGIVIFAGLPLVGWGVPDARGFIGNPARLGYIVLVVLLQVFFVIKFPGVGHNRSKEKKIVHRQRLAIILLQASGLAIIIAAPYCDRRDIAVLGLAEVVRYLGLAIFSLGFLATSWAEAFLGKQFSLEVTIQEDHRLVTDGPYRYLRHPRYLGIILFNIGFSFVFRSWLALIIIAAMSLVLLWRIHDEEGLMHREFGADWEAYSQRSWRLIPFVY